MFSKHWQQTIKCVVENVNANPDLSPEVKKNINIGYGMYALACLTDVVCRRYLK